MNFILCQFKIILPIMPLSLQRIPRSLHRESQLYPWGRRNNNISLFPARRNAIIFNCGKMIHFWKIGVFATLAINVVIVHYCFEISLRSMSPWLKNSLKLLSMRQNFSTFGTCPPLAISYPCFPPHLPCIHSLLSFKNKRLFVLILL